MESYWPSTVCWIIAGVWLLAILLYLLLFRLRPSLKNRRGIEVKVFEIEVPPDQVDKILGISKPRGRILELKGKLVKRRIAKRKNET